MLQFFDITHGGYTDVIMRTTLTIDDDLANSLKEQARLNNVPLKQVVNETLRRGLSSVPNGDRPPSRVEPLSSDSRPELDPKYYKNILHDEDVQHYLDSQGR